MIGGLAAYLRWHLRDAALRAFAPVIIAFGLLGIPILTMAQASGWAALRADGDAQRGLLAGYAQLVPTVITLGALLVASGFVAADRDRGYVRFLFSAPVVPWRYYLQRFVVGLTAFVAACALVPIGFGLMITARPVAPVLASAALYGYLIGALAMLAGALTRRDGAVVLGIVMLSSILQPLAAQAELAGWVEFLAAILPPLGPADAVRGAVLAGRAVDRPALVHVLGYATGMLVSALVLIRRAPLVR